MNRLRDLVRRQKRGFEIPDWLDRLVSVGIVTDDPQIKRRQRFTNVAAFATAANAAQHLIVNLVHAPRELIALHVYNIVVIAVALTVHKLHRFGANTVAGTLLSFIIAGHMFVVWMFGRDSGLHIYFMLAGAILFMFGVQQWRTFLAWFIVAFAAFVIVLQFAPEKGLVLIDDIEFRRSLSAQAMINMILINAIIVFYALAALQQAEDELQDQHLRSEALLEIVMPLPIAARLKSGEERIADRIASLSVLFADIVGFTGAARDLPPAEVVEYLDSLFRVFDALCERHGVEKIKTIGDSYMAVSGLRDEGIDGAVTIADLALAMLDIMEDHPPLGTCKLALRIGLHCGTAVAGVIGDMRIAYDVWGQTVNIASRMESHGVAGRIQVSEAFYSLTSAYFRFHERGSIDVKGIGAAKTFFLSAPCEERIRQRSEFRTSAPCEKRKRW